MKIWTPRLSWKQDDSLERQSDTSESWSDILERQEFNKYGMYNERKMPSGCLHHTCSYVNDLDMYPTTTCDCGRKFNSLRGSRIHKARWCKQRNSPTGECKSNDGFMNQDYPHSIHEPIAERQRPGDIPGKPRI